MWVGVHLFERGERPVHRFELFKAVRCEPDHSLESEVGGAVLLGHPGSYDVSLEKLRDFFENFLRDLRDVEFVDQGARDLVQRRLPLKGEALRKLDLVDAGGPKLLMVLLDALDVEIRFGGRE